MNIFTCGEDFSEKAQEAQHSSKQWAIIVI